MYRVNDSISNDILSEIDIEILINKYGYDLLIDTIENMISNNEKRESDFREILNSSKEVLNEINKQKDLLKERLKELNTNK